MTTLKQALKLLDPQNDEHWTAGGLPRVEALEQLTGTQLSRADVEAAAPDLKRSNAEAAPAPAQPQPPADNDHVAEGTTKFPDGVMRSGDAAVLAGHEIEPGKKVGGVEARLAEVEADLAYLRKQFGWPTRSA
jgi:hypothetical protein